jgi:hypothetical protein
VCPTELAALADKEARLDELHADVISVSTDTVYAHKVWRESSPLVSRVAYPMGADPTGEISRAFEAYDENGRVSRFVDSRRRRPDTIPRARRSALGAQFDEVLGPSRRGWGPRNPRASLRRRVGGDGGRLGGGRPPLARAGPGHDPRSGPG